MPDDPQLFLYRGCVFSCVPQQQPGQTFGIQVNYVSGPLGPPADLPVDTEPYQSEAEARRHGEQQAMRWVHDRTGDGQGQF